MKIDVALTPRLLGDPASSAVIVVDVLRATSSLVTMFERGLTRAIVSANLRDARRLARDEFALLCGEVNSVPVAGFDYGNSPAELSEQALQGRSAVLMTTNGTRAVIAAAAAPVVTCGALLNRSAVGRYVATQAASRDLNVSVVCAGTERGEAFSLEDAVGAGAIIEAMREHSSGVWLSDAAWGALHLWRWHRGDVMRAFCESAHGRALRALGLEADLEFCARIDQFTAVPLLGNESGLPVLRLAPT